MKRKWTFMVYMTGNNGEIFSNGKHLKANLQQAGWSDITDMAKIGSSEQIAIVAQYNTLDQQLYTPRLYIDKGSETGPIVEKIPPTGMGSSDSLTDFIVWATTHYPAEKYALVLWNHSTGWKKEDIYTLYREQMQSAYIPDYTELSRVFSTLTT